MICKKCCEAADMKQDWRHEFCDDCDCQHYPVGTRQIIRSQMTEINPEIWDNKTLGAAAANENLDRLTRQQLENASAKAEGREPREIVVDNTYPGWTPEVNDRTGTVSSNYQHVHFADEQPADIPTDSGQPESDAGTVSEPDAETNSEPTPDSQDSGVDSESSDESQVSTASDTPANESESNVTHPVEEGNNTQWT